LGFCADYFLFEFKWIFLLEGKFFEIFNLRMRRGEILKLGLFLVVLVEIFGKEAPLRAGGGSWIGDFGDGSKIDCKNIFCWKTEY
jgi:hypothetical protein